MAGYLPGLDTTPPPVSYSSTTTDPENPPPPATKMEQPQKEKGLPVARKNRCSCWRCTVIGISTFVVAALGAMTFLMVWFSDMTPPDYSAAIDSVSGLDPTTTDLRLPALDPAFNLTLRVASVSRRYSACIEPGTYAEVAYRCITLAATATAQERLCAGPREAAEKQLVARGTGVRVPGAVLDSLAADMRQGAPVFQVTIRMSGGDYADGEVVASCGGRRVGDTDDDLGTSCDAWHYCP